MRSLTFDMIGMILMAIVTGLTTFGGITWAYLKETGGSTAPPTVRQAADNDPGAPTTGGARPSADHVQRVHVGHH